MDRRGRLVGDEFTTPETEIADAASGGFTLSYAGPTGSGRYWDVGVSFRAGHRRLKGFCFVTSTVGWRHVGGNRALADRVNAQIGWLQDVDGDGHQELVVRSSFDVTAGASLSDTAITASAFDFAGDRFVLDVAATSALRSKIADAYRDAAAAKNVRAEDRQHYLRAERLLRKSACQPGQ